MIIPYKDGEFETTHAAGSRIITASNVPALFGKSRFVGQTALFYHLLGTVPLPPVDTVLTRRGRRYERLAAEDVAEAKGWEVEQVFGYAEHSRLGRRFMASPDAVARRQARDALGIGEAKTVAEPIYEELWAEGPPLDVELQHQAQFACTGAKWGYISALVIGAFRHDIVVYETAPNPAAIELIEKAAEAFLALLDAGTPPEPDQHETSLRALHGLYPKADPGKILLMEDEASASRFDEWVRARDMRLSAEKAEKAAKEWFQAQAQDAGLIRLAGGRSIEIKVIERAGYTVKPTSYRKLDAKVIQPLIGGRVDL